MIAPYAGQIGAIERILHDPQRIEHLSHLLEGKRVDSPLAVEISTVDGFEGREKKVIVFSTTRSNPRHAIGFMDDWRRLNVALTRAQRVSWPAMQARWTRDGLFDFCFLPTVSYHGRSLPYSLKRERLLWQSDQRPSILDRSHEDAQAKKRHLLGRQEEVNRAINNS